MKSRVAGSGFFSSLAGRIVVIAVIVAFVVVDVLLVAAALRATAPVDPGTPGPIPTYTSSPQPTATASASAAIDEPSGEVRLLSAVSATEAWRTTPGLCGGAAPKVERSTDGGDTWAVVDLGSTGVADAVALNAGSDRTALAGHLTGSCTKTKAMATFTEGKFWAASTTDVADLAFVVRGSNRVHLASGVVAGPCATPLGAVQSGSAAAVSCADAFAVKNGDAAWQTVTVDGLLAFTATGTGTATSYLLAVDSASDDCDGVAIESLTADLTPDSVPTPVGCAPVASAAGTLDPSTVALSRVGANVWLWAGSRVSVSADGGASW
ncbi:hypothetical protein [Frondihabitans sp. Leaf304]|uniref:hypothetical protein n=1 Tax=Frondihabitans sp. Leaf304 TaxID=1736329 RepID=UPI0006FF733A|nr:hypothetical protein [Frondihabitans sp. Leaf304]KQQ28375.1 hypothetical protein ASF54_06755 [Frondihabitans sp. Leaf304]